MKEFSEFKLDIEKEKKTVKEDIQSSDPMSDRANVDIMLKDYNQTIPRQKHDKDLSEILEIVRILNNMAPIRMPEYSFDINEINGEYYYRPNGSLLLVREYDSDVIRDYYASEQEDLGCTVSRILEHDKTTGRLKTKIEPIMRKGSRLKSSITIFDLKVNNKYIIIQLSEGGFVNNISEFTGKGKSFQTLFRNIDTLKPARYIEGKDDFEKGFEMIDCIFDSNGNIVKIKRFSGNKEVNINYSQESKNISVKVRQ
ncbi:hypothetical protein IKB17_01290 [bacterium]|nr:hypothetical protein [bacterium]